MHEKFVEIAKKYVKHHPADQPLDFDKDLQDYGIDSMEQIKLLVEIEETFNIVMPDEYLVQETFSSFRNLYEATEQTIKKISSIN